MGTYMKYIFFVYIAGFFVFSTMPGPWAKTFNKDDKRPFFVQYADVKTAEKTKTIWSDNEKYAPIDQEEIIKKVPSVRKIIIKNE